MQNPFTLVFGRSPLESISRLAQTNEIIESFSAEFLNQQIYMITGVRGSGKTVMLTIVKKMKKRVLISIDVVTSNTEMQVFASTFQIFVRNEYPVFLLMTGLFSKIS